MSGAESAIVKIFRLELFDVADIVVVDTVVIVDL
jgi:hypothetical protein